MKPTANAGFPPSTGGLRGGETRESRAESSRIKASGINAPTALPLEGEGVAAIRRKLVAWSRRRSRSLPWREVADPYKVWVSEIMLQQTTVAAVIGYFNRFLERFPTLDDLANSPLEDVLKAWEGLGYYSRARNMHAAAEQIIARHGGEFPRSIDELMSLPGIGRYTAGAILSFAFGLPAPILEANTQRLYSRLAGFAGDTQSAAGQRALWDIAKQLVPSREPGRFNQALMDLGAIVCTPNEPDCLACPLQSCCQAFLTGKVASIPRPKSRLQITPRLDVCLVAWVEPRKNKLLVRRCGEDERWTGLWDFPRVTLLEGSAAEGHRSHGTPREAANMRRKIVQSFERQYELRVTLGEPFCELRHTVTRYRIHLVCHAATVGRSAIQSLAGEWKQVTPNALESLPLTATARRIANAILVAKRA